MKTRYLTFLFGILGMFILEACGVTPKQAAPQPAGSGTAVPTIKLIAAGGHHSLALKTDGTLYGTGDNYYGELGTGDTANKSNWTQVLLP